MTEVIRFALLGAGVGTLYALGSQGLVLVYRGSGVLNFAHGAVGMVGAYVAWELSVQHGLAYGPAFLAGVLVCALLGAATHLLVMRPLRTASPLARVVATLGILIVLQALAVLRYGPNTIIVASNLPTDALNLPGGVTISVDRLILLAIGILVAAVLWAAYRFTNFGLATSAVAENQRAASALGWSPDAIATANWALGSGLAGAAAILVSPIVQLQPWTMTNLMLSAMAAALVANFRSFPIACLAGLGIGVTQTELERFVTVDGLASSVPFAVIVAVMIMRGQALPLRDFFMQRLPTVGSGRIRPVPFLVAVLLAAVAVRQLSVSWQDSLTMTFAVAIVLLSITVLTGYAGQISLCQYVIAGMGAYIAGRLASVAGWPFLAALVAGVIGTAVLGMLLALPALRTRGINLAIVTFGIGSAVELMLFNSPRWTGGYTGTIVEPPSIFGISFDPIVHADRYAYLSLAFLALAILVAGNVRRGRSGRRMLAVRSSERAAAALGINVTEVKLYAFGLSAGIAALGGILIAFHNTSILYNQFTNFLSITSVGWAVIGGVGYLLGPFLGATFAPGALGASIGNSAFSSFPEYIPLIGGCVLVLMVLQNQNGMAYEQIRQFRWIQSKLARPGRDDAKQDDGAPPSRRRASSSARVVLEDADEGQRERVAPRTLEVRDVTVRFGGVVAVNDVSLTVAPGRVVGLIGPNGAGKTTLLDAVTGFVQPAAGSIKVDGVEMSGLRPARRVGLGVSRSFQALELFEDMTVFDNLRTASDPRGRLSYLTDLVYPVDPPLSGEVRAAIKEFGLEDLLDRPAMDLPHGQRRLLAIARAVATRPSLLLLDEPASGLGEIESAELARLVRRLADDWNLGILLVEHDMDVVMAICDEIVVLNFGEKIAAGTPQVIRNEPAVIAAYLGEAIEDVPEPSTVGIG